jgi:hypothetical protein
MNAHRNGSGPARTKLFELKDELKEWHNQPGSKVQADEKGCFGGAYNAWLRESGGILDEGQVCEMAILECFNVKALFNIMLVDLDKGDMMTEEQRQRLLDFELVLDMKDLEVLEYEAGIQCALGLKENGLARYEEGDDQEEDDQEEDDLARYQDGWM